jgi:hypothetical protein
MTPIEIAIATMRHKAQELRCLADDLDTRADSLSRSIIDTTGEEVPPTERGVRLGSDRPEVQP